MIQTNLWERCLNRNNDRAYWHATAVSGRGGMTRLSKTTPLSRETLYRTLSKKGNPRLETLSKVLGDMGLRIGVVPARR